MSDIKIKVIFLFIYEKKCLGYFKINKTKKKKIVGPLQVGIIGGSGLDDPEFLDDRREIYRETPYGKYFKI